MRDHHLFLVLSSATFHGAVDLGPIPDRPDAHSYVLCHQLKSLDWKVRGASPHPMGVVPAEQLQQVQEIVAQILSFCP